MFQNILLPKTGRENYGGDRAPLNMVQASTRHPFTQKLDKYYIFNCKKMANLLMRSAASLEILGKYCTEGLNMALADYETFE